MAARQKFQKALMLLDRGAVDRGEAILREVIVEAEHESDEVALVQGLVCLGDLLYELDRKSEARSYLERALKNRRDDDVLAYEFARAAELLIRPE
ncbi:MULTISPECIES: hypothetical protein [Burkholderia]|uniref:Tetratricopeptide repeat protein n=1 Tax=Burkholderia paludis TaxID=1506587 RepID=A0A6J5FAI9_9BURK|nr:MULTISPECIES: hypothetical protein [Burkholderia]CAB3774216.1 hypothetical protein LMG30113_07517 [Burkholderia paludis]VWC48338.1 hypothetical protein BPA30113_07511 [Burkholderia paludis]